MGKKKVVHKIEIDGCGALILIVIVIILLVNLFK